MVKGTGVISLGKKKPGREDVKIFQIFEKTFYRKHIIYVLMSRAGPKVLKTQRRRLQFSLSELLRNSGKILGRVTNGSS